MTLIRKSLMDLFWRDGKRTWHVAPHQSFLSSQMSTPGRWFGFSCTNVYILPYIRNRQQYQVIYLTILKNNNRCTPSNVYPLTSGRLQISIPMYFIITVHTGTLCSSGAWEFCNLPLHKVRHIVDDIIYVDNIRFCKPLAFELFS